MAEGWLDRRSQEGPIRQLAGVVGDVDGRERLDAMADAVIECDTVADVLARLAK